MDKIIVIGGATGVGKTNLSISIASRFNGEIINADASQFHKLLDIGTSKIKLSEMNGIKHHLIDFLDIKDEYSIFDFQTNGRKIIDEIIKEGKLPIVVGGSGLYIESLINDYELSSNKVIHNDSIYENYSNEELYELLDKLNHELAILTHPNNRQRVLRYLERAKDIENGLDSVKKDPKPLYDYLYLYVSRDRNEIYNRINHRTIKMFEDGWIDECKNLKKLGYDLSAIKEIGYKEINDYLENKINYNELIDLIQKDTRHYAKRQITWFKNKANCINIDLDKTSTEDILEIINNFLNK